MLNVDALLCFLFQYVIFVITYSSRLNGEQDFYTVILNLYSHLFDNLWNTGKDNFFEKLESMSFQLATAK